LDESLEVISINDCCQWFFSGFSLSMRSAFQPRGEIPHQFPGILRAQLRRLVASAHFQRACTRPDIFTNLQQAAVEFAQCRNKEPVRAICYYQLFNAPELKGFTVTVIGTIIVLPLASVTSTVKILAPELAGVAEKTRLKSPSKLGAAGLRRLAM
jgi:hypothetical protein